MKEIKVLKGNEFGFPHGSSKWCDEPLKRTTIMRLKVECRGRGIAGESWYEYVMPKNDIKPNELQYFTTYNDEHIMLNTSNVVIVENFDLIEKDYITLNDNFIKIPEEIYGTEESFRK